MSNETIIIPKIQENSDFSKLSAGKVKLVRKITVFNWREGKDFWFELTGQVWKNEGSRNWDSTVVILKPRIVYSMTSMDSLVKSEPYKRDNSSPYEKFKKTFQRNFKRLFSYPPQKNSIGLRLLWFFFIVFFDGNNLRLKIWLLLLSFLYIKTTKIKSGRKMRKYIDFNYLLKDLSLWIFSCISRKAFFCSAR